MKLPLEGIKVVELGTHVVVPNVARYLADWGADVIKVEGLTGEEWRVIGKAYQTLFDDEENPIFQGQNANKRFIAINLKDPQGMDVFHKLLKEADIFVSNVRMKSLKKMGLDYDGCKAINDKLIYAHFTGFGYSGPDKDRPGFDMAAFWAKTGTMSEWVSTGDYPFKPPGGFGDAVVSASLTAGVIAALYARTKTNKGTYVTSSLYGAGLWYNQTGLLSAQPPYNNEYPKDKLEPSNPFSHIYKCKDGEYLITTIIDYEGKYEQVCKMLGLDEFIGDKRYDNRTPEGLGNMENKRAFTAKVFEAFEKKDRDEWCKLFDEADFVYERLLHYTDVYKDEQAWANNYLRNVTFPTTGNTIAFPVVPVQFKEFPQERFDLPGAIGSDTKEIILELGMNDKEYEELAAKKAVK